PGLQCRRPSVRPVRQPRSHRLYRRRGEGRRSVDRHAGVQGLVFGRTENSAGPAARALAARQSRVAAGHRRQHCAYAGRGLRLEAGAVRAQMPGSAARRLRH
nr:hypothetical protein [Tanacetum cinerariifolium]